MKSRKPTIYEVLRAKLGREPTHAELVADCKRIIQESSPAPARTRKRKATREGTHGR